MRSRSQITGFIVSNSASSRSKERKVWKSQLTGISRRKDTLSNHRKSSHMLIKENDPRKNYLGMLLLSDESDCNVVDDDELDNMRAALVS
jgi:hypothetical protein